MCGFRRKFAATIDEANARSSNKVDFGQLVSLGEELYLEEFDLNCAARA